MRAVQQDRYGDADVLELRDVPLPVPGDHEVLIRVRAASINPADWHLMTGLPTMMRPFLGMRGPREATRGVDVAGTVHAVGPKVTAFRRGDEVLGTARGSFADYAIARADRLVAKPAELGWAQAASLPLAGSAAVHAVRAAGVASGRRVLVIGAAGGIGSIVVQLAVAAGAEVTGVCSGGKAALVRSLGAQRVIDYTSEPLEGRYDAIIDTAGGRALAELRGLLTATGTLVLVGAEGGGRVLGGMERQFAALLRDPFTKQHLRSVVSSETPEVLGELVAHATAGRLRPVIDHEVGLESVADGIRHLAAGRAAGKVVVVP
jgi:NADPH:quinone reductase-like Zn-dependent oxidoreductase